MPIKPGFFYLKIDRKAIATSIGLIPLVMGEKIKPRELFI